MSDERVFGLRAIPENLRKIANALAETVIVDAGGNPSDENKAAARERIEIVIQAFVEETKKAEPSSLRPLPFSCPLSTQL